MLVATPRGFGSRFGAPTSARSIVINTCPPGPNETIKYELNENQFCSNGEMGKLIYAISCHLFGYFYGKLIQIIGLKAPGNYSHQFRSDNFSILLCEGPITLIFMISGFLDVSRPPLKANIIYLWRHQDT